jgi:Ulp1 family protease
MTSILFPINHNNNHWLLIHVNIKNKEIQQIDSLHSATQHDYTETFLQYIKTTLSTSNETEWTTLHKLTPQQENGYDCGVHMLGNIQRIAHPSLINNANPS